MAQRMALYLQDKHDISYELEVAEYAEQQGFSEIWQADTRLARDCVVMMSALLTRTSTLRIGSGVLPIYSRNPAVIAATWSTMWELGGLTPDGESRVMLGLGAWWEPIAGRTGTDRRKPLTAMRENVEAIRALFAMEEVSYDGEFVHLDRVALDVAYGDRSPRDIPIYIGATGPKMLELTGEICDGAVLNYVVSTDYIRDAVDTVAIGAARSGRTIDQIDRPELLACALSDDDPEEAMLTGKSLVAYYLGTEPHIMKASGADPELVARVQEIVGWPATEEDYRQAAHLIPDDLARKLMAVGTSEQCREKVAEYIDAGVTCPILYPLMPDIKPVVDAFAHWNPWNAPTTVLITGGAVVTVDDQFTVHDPGWVSVEGADIAEVGSGEPPATLTARAERVIDATGQAVMPGMVNAHTHLFQAFFRGLADDKPLLEWLEESIWPGASVLDADTAGLAARSGLVENLRSGVTTVIDHQYVHVDPAIDDAVCQAAADLGLRLRLARGWADRNYHPALSETADQVIERTAVLRERWHGFDDRIGIELAPLIPWGCSDEAMRETAAAARNWGAGTHIHCAETATEVEMNLEERGSRHVAWLDQLGALGPDTQLAHAVWLDDDELDLVAQRGAVVVHCPVSNMYLASGVARIVEMRQRGITVALASDGPGSNNRQDLFEVMKQTVLLQKVHRLDAMALQPEDAIVMACRGGAAAAGLADRIGVLEPGRAADLVIVDLDNVFTSPVHRVASALVFNATPGQVRTVMVAGRVLVDDGELAVADEAALLADGRRCATALFERAGVASRLTPT